MTPPLNASRRLFLQQTAALSGLGVAAPFALNLAAISEAAAQTAGDYKALVCIFLQGGNDSFNTVLPTDSASWANYTSVRNQQPDSLALARDSVLPISPLNTQGRTFALNPGLTQTQSLFNTDKRVAILSNVGTLIEPINTKAEYETKAKRLPPKLFSHNDQQTTWQALGPEGTAHGWGGRMADMIASGNGNSLFTAISATGNSVWLSGQNVKQYQVAASGPVRFGSVLTPQGVPVIHNTAQVASALDRIVRANQKGGAFGADLASLAGRSIDAEKLLSQHLPTADHASLGTENDLKYFSPLTNSVQVSPLAQQLKMVARTIAARGGLGMKRQVFFVNLYGFDTHDNQNKNHADLMARLDHALKYFDTTLTRLGVNQQVTTFTASDFGRSFTSNGDGSDHGWGGHHLVMGGAVKGGDIYGAFPTLAAKNSQNNNFDGSPDQLTNGVLLPRVSIEQYGATLGRWFGLSDGQLGDVFPNLSNFSGKTNLGFMRA